MKTKYQQQMRRFTRKWGWRGSFQLPVKVEKNTSDGELFSNSKGIRMFAHSALWYFNTQALTSSTFSGDLIGRGTPVLCLVTLEVCLGCEHLLEKYITSPLFQRMVDIELCQNTTLSLRPSNETTNALLQHQPTGWCTFKKRKSAAPFSWQTFQNVWHVS